MTLGSIFRVRVKTSRKLDPNMTLNDPYPFIRGRVKGQGQGRVMKGSSGVVEAAMKKEAATCG